MICRVSMLACPGVKVKVGQKIPLSKLLSGKGQTGEATVVLVAEDGGFDIEFESNQAPPTVVYNDVEVSEE